jgi:hypothetical protein
LLLGRIIPESRNIDGAFADEVISDGVLVHDGDLEYVVEGGEVEGFVPDGTFAGLIFGAGAVGLGTEFEDAVGVLGGEAGTMFEKI